MTQETESFKSYWARLRKDIQLFFKLINFNPSSDQLEIALEAQDAALNPQRVPERLIIKAGTGVGKSALTAALGLWLLIRTYGTKIIVTAPTERQVRTVLMAEIRGHIRNGPTWFQEMFDIHLTKVNLKGNEDWQILPITASEATSVQGQHHKGLWILVEEVSGISDDILMAFMRTLSQRGNGMIGIGNPNHRQGVLFRAFTSQTEHWPRRFTMNKIRLAEERPDLVDPDSIRQIRDEYGEDSFQYRVGVLGEFPFSEGQTVLDYSLILRAVETPKHQAIQKSSRPRRRRLSLDFARYGGDLNVVGALAGNAVVEFEKGVGEPYDYVMRAFQIQEARRWKDAETEYIPDAVGMGQALLVLFDRGGKRWIPYGSHYASPDATTANAESSAWFQFKALLENEMVSIPPDPELIEQLATRTYSYMPATNLIKVESKAEYRKRTGQKSPDEADALVQLFFDPEGSKGMQGSVLAERSAEGLDQQQIASMMVGGNMGPFFEDDEYHSAKKQAAAPGSMELWYDGPSPWSQSELWGR